MSVFSLERKLTGGDLGFQWLLAADTNYGRRISIGIAPGDR
jgi:hypothetical protein